MLDLYDFRRRVAAMYAERNAAPAGGAAPVEVWERFRAARDDLFTHHPQSALSAEQRRHFRGLDYFPYSEAARVTGTLVPGDEGDAVPVGTSGEEALPMRRVGRIRFDLGGVACALTLYWIDVYGGGLFLPFRDTTAPHETYGGGRYLVDTVKGSDFPRYERAGDGATVVLDFNYAYNPSCAYDYRWACPLAPRENHLPVPVRAGERVFRPVSDPG